MAVIRNVYLGNCPIFWTTTVEGIKTRAHEVIAYFGGGRMGVMPMRHQALVVAMAADGCARLDNVPRFGVHIGALEAYQDLYLSLVVGQGDGVQVSEFGSEHLYLHNLRVPFPGDNPGEVAMDLLRGLPEVPR